MKEEEEPFQFRALSGPFGALMVSECNAGSPPRSGWIGSTPHRPAAMTQSTFFIGVFLLFPLSPSVGRLLPSKAPFRLASKAKRSELKRKAAFSLFSLSLPQSGASFREQGEAS